MRLIKNARGSWVAVFKTVHGERRQDLFVSDKKDAMRRARDAKIADLEINRIHRDVIAKMLTGKQVSVSKAIDEWEESLNAAGNLKERTTKEMARTIRHWAAHQDLEKQSPAMVKPEHVSKWVDANDGTKLSTRKLRLCHLRTFLEWCIGMGYSLGSNYARVKRRVNMSALDHTQKEVERKIPFTDDEISSMLGFLDSEIAKVQIDIDRINPGSRKSSDLGKEYAGAIRRLKFWKSAIVISRWTGLRLSDIARLEWESLSTPGMMIVWTTKRDKRVPLPLNDKLNAAIADIDKVHDHYCYPIQREIIMDINRRTLLQKQFAYIMAKSGIKDKSFHCLRSTAALDMRERLMEAGKSQEESEIIVAQILGHGSADTTRRSYLGGKV